MMYIDIICALYILLVSCSRVVHTASYEGCSSVVLANADVSRYDGVYTKTADSGCPVYAHYGGVYFLYYFNDTAATVWIVGIDKCMNEGYIAVSDPAEFPENVTATWQEVTSGEFQSNANIKVTCYAGCDYLMLGGTVHWSSKEGRYAKTADTCGGRIVYGLYSSSVTAFIYYYPTNGVWIVSDISCDTSGWMFNYGDQEFPENLTTTWREYDGSSDTSDNTNIQVSCYTGCSSISVHGILTSTLSSREGTYTRTGQLCDSRPMYYHAESQSYLSHWPSNTGGIWTIGITVCSAEDSVVIYAEDDSGYPEDVSLRTSWRELNQDTNTYNTNPNLVVECLTYTATESTTVEAELPAAVIAGITISVLIFIVIIIVATILIHKHLHPRKVEQDSQAHQRPASVINVPHHLVPLAPINERPASSTLMLRLNVAELDLKLSEARSNNQQEEIARLQRLLEQAKAEDKVVIPDNWKEMTSGRPVELVNLDKSSDEYKDLEKTFKTSINNSKLSVINIQRVQNITLYRQYIVEKEAVEQANGHSLTERILYHGTSGKGVLGINAGHFNRTFAGVNANKFGKGAYFAKCASYSVQLKYTPPDEDKDGHRYMYMCRVVVGDFTQGSEDLKDPPWKETAQGDTMTVKYDSVVNNVDNPTIFVVFKDTKAYPEYLITFK